jgi:hypothetical protein
LFFPLGSFSCDFGLKAAEMLLVSAATGLPAGQFTVYKKSRPDRAIPDSAENLILFSHLETQGACSNLPR